MDKAKTKKKITAGEYTNDNLVLKLILACKVQGKRRARVVTLKSAPKRKKPSKSVTKSKNKKATAKLSVEELLQKVFILIN